MRRISPLLAAVVAAMMLTACASSHPASQAVSHPSTAVASPSASPSPPPGPQAYVAILRSSGIFHGNVQAIPDSALLQIGQDVCKYFADGGSYSGMILGLLNNNLKPSTAQATVVTDAAIRNLCPQFSNLLPAGAP